MTIRDLAYEEELESYRRGLNAEKRFQSIVLSLTVRHLWIHKIEVSSDVEDLLGIDFVVTITDAIGTAIRIPVQVKSSAEGVKLHLQKYQGNWRSLLFTCVIHDHRSDEEIVCEILNGLTYVRNKGINYKDVFTAVRSTVVHPKTLEQYRGTVMSLCRPHCLSQMKTYQ